MAAWRAVTICRTVEEIRAAAREAAAAMPPLTQEQADLIAALIEPHVHQAQGLDTAP